MEWQEIFQGGHYTSKAQPSVLSWEQLLLSWSFKVDRLDRVEKILDKIAKSQDKADRQRAKDKAEARAEAKARQKEWAQQRAKDKAEARAEAKARQAEARAEAKARQAEARAEAKARQKEWAQQRAKDKAEADARQKEADRRLAENAWLISNLGKNVRGMGLSIGEITEAITVSGKIIALVNKFTGIKVDGFLPNLEKTYLLDPDGALEGKNRRQFEIDGLAVGETEAVVIEAKTKLNKRDVDSFIKGLARFKEAFGEYADRDIYACVAFVRTNDKTLAYAEKRGLFIIRATPPDVELLNGKKFKPVKFA